MTYYKTFVTDGHTDCYGTNDYKTTAPERYKPLNIAEKCQEDRFKVDLIDHQQGKTDYPTFIKISAGFGIEKWVVCMDKMTCTYYDKAGNEILVEKIPN